MEINNLESLSIEELIRAFCSQRNEKAWGEVTVRLRPRLRRDLIRNNSVQVVEESIAKAFAKYYFKVKEAQELCINEFWKLKGYFDFSTGKPFQPWIRTMVINLIIDDLRMHGLKEVPLPESAETDCQSIEFSFGPDTFFGEPFYYEDEEVERQLEVIYLIVSRSLDENEDEFNYFDIFWENGPAHPSGEEAIKEFYDRTGRIITPTYVSSLKKSVRRKARLALLEAKYNIERVFAYYTPMEGFEEEQEANYKLMMDKIWRSFIKNQKVVNEVKRGLPKYRWLDKLKAAQQGYNQIENRIEVLQIAYSYFIGIGERPYFVELIEIYCADCFGGKVKDCFMGSKVKQ